MNGFSVLKGLAVALATVGLLMPMERAEAAQGDQRPTVSLVKPGTVVDISLASGATFTGRVVDHNGQGLEAAEVVFHTGKKEVARVTCDEKGVFTANGLKNGVYTVSSGKSVGTFRVWDAKVAPKAAKPYALLVNNTDAARGQDYCDSCNQGQAMGGPVVSGMPAYGGGDCGCGYCGMNEFDWCKALLWGVAIAALVIGIIALADDDDDGRAAPATP